MKDRSSCSPAAMPSSTLTATPRWNRSHDEAFEQIPAEPVYLLDGQHVALAQVSMAAVRLGRSSVRSLPDSFSSKSFTQIGSSASCCRAVS
jgi:hypothetical protein